MRPKWFSRFFSGNKIVRGPHVVQNTLKLSLTKEEQKARKKARKRQKLARRLNREILRNATISKP